MNLILKLNNESDTRAAAAKLGQMLRPGDLVALWGDLGAGKTTFARALIQQLNPAETEVPSPTFTLLQQYAVPQGALYHLDLYRLADPDEVHALGWDELQSGIMLVEWPERLGTLLPSTRFDARLQYGDTPDSRTLSLSGDDRLKEMA